MKTRVVEVMESRGPGLVETGQKGKDRLGKKSKSRGREGTKAGRIGG